jgi:hypothetical protein
LSGAAPHAPRALARTIDRCLSHSPAGRFQSAGELAAALEQLGSGPSELPAPLRGWLTRDERTRGFLTLWSAGWGLVAGAVVSTINHLPGLGLALVLVPLTIAVGPWAVFGLARLLRTRKVLAAGYTLSDLILALKNHAERTREELTFEIGKPPSRLGRWLRKLTWASLGAAIVLPIVPGWGPRSVLAMAWFVAAGLSIGGAMLGMAIPGRALPIKDDRTWRERIWAGPIGRFLTKLAGWRLGRRGAPEHTLHRPTEIALGEAADALFQALPAAHRADLADLPDRIASLSRQAQYLRRRIEELDDLIAQAAPSTLFDGERAAGDGGADVLIATRATIAEQLTETVALLESLRVGLLKLHAGTATPESIATQLTMVRELSAHLDELADAHTELSSFLREEPPTPVSSSAG